MESFQFYLIALLAVVIGIFLIKKFVGCMVRMAVTIILVLILAALYYMYC